MEKIDLIGRRFGRLLVVANGAGIRDGRGIALRTWVCKCDCGRGTSVITGSLTKGNTKSCGCLNTDRVRAAHTTHAATVNATWTVEYRTWMNIKSRCFNPRNRHFPLYGGRGITMDPVWRRDFSAFLSHVGHRPSAEFSIDRINNEGGYTPGNVRWTDQATQLKNRRKTIWVVWQGVRMTLSECAKASGIKYMTLFFRNQKGQPLDAKVKSVGARSASRYEGV